MWELIALIIIVSIVFSVSLHDAFIGIIIFIVGVIVAIIGSLLLGSTFLKAADWLVRLGDGTKPVPVKPVRAKVIEPSRKSNKVFVWLAILFITYVLSALAIILLQEWFPQLRYGNRSHSEWVDYPVISALLPAIPFTIIVIGHFVRKIINKRKSPKKG